MAIVNYNTVEVFDAEWVGILPADECKEILLKALKRYQKDLKQEEEDAEEHMQVGLMLKSLRVKIRP